MSLKTRSMQKVLEPIEVQINKLRQLLANESAKPPDVVLVKSLFVEQLQSLADKFENLSKEDATDYQELKSKITGIIEQFCSISNVNDLVQSIHCQNGEDVTTALFKKFLSCLKTLEKLECLPLKQSLQDCWDYVKEMGAVNEIEDLQNIKEIGVFIMEVFEPVQRYRKNLVSKLLSEKIGLYSCQLCVSFGMLVHVIQEQHHLNAPIYTCKKYICERLCWCFKMIIEVLDCENPTEEDENFEKENHFVYRMDLVLDIISGMPGKSQEDLITECADLWLGIEDVFSHAMAIAQVCQLCNFNAITATSQSIMSEYENLKTQLLSEKPDPTLNNLFMNTLNDALYRLERKVNISVLTLVMEVFSDPFGALRKLVKTCGNLLTAKKRSKNDLSSAVEEFDQVTDKAMQIGMFAIACCKDINRVNKIRNCLASLESLETELVPAITSFYLHPDNKEMQASVKLLTAQWQLEINKLHNVVDLIIDSAAYCQVVLDDLQERVSVMSDCLDNRERVTQAQVHGIVQRAVSLSSQLTATVNDIGRDNIERQTTMMIQELKAAIFEADAASKTLLVENATDPQQLRVIKRCELILNVVKRLQPALITTMNNSILTNSSYGKAGMGQGDTLNESRLSFPSSIFGLPRDENSLTYIRTPYTVKSYKPPLSIQPANSLPRAPSNLSCLIPYIKRGRTMRTERSVMYKTPRKAENSEDTSMRNELKMRNLSSIRQHLFSRDSFISQDNLDLSVESIDLTSILDKVTSLSDTLNSSLGKSPVSAKPTMKNSPDSFKEHSENIKVASGIYLGNLCQSMDTIGECSGVGGGDAPSAIDASVKVEDIQRLDRKIEIAAKNSRRIIFP
ncbi:uncharacterized protein LOC107275131 [Cephus cinctus]|uniref:Uncharacterized protein LOC107275131 n=1 Tax=Cephus cinctus TaxID=211228 RepID=A0AAJ7CGR8_CEPCN|nr:uncharacterized protein LOC107275131 [Cephus cinctus]